VGHTESTSGICSIIKAVFAIESLSVFTPNLQFKKAKKRMVGIEKGRLIPVRKKTFFEAHDVVI
jgi:hypothetical protein